MKRTITQRLNIKGEWHMVHFWEFKVSDLIRCIDLNTGEVRTNDDNKSLFKITTIPYDTDVPGTMGIGLDAIA